MRPSSLVMRWSSNGFNWGSVSNEIASQIIYTLMAQASFGTTWGTVYINSLMRLTFTNWPMMLLDIPKHWFCLCLLHQTENLMKGTWCLIIVRFLIVIVENAPAMWMRGSTTVRISWKSWSFWWVLMINFAKWDLTSFH